MPPATATPPPVDDDRCYGPIEATPQAAKANFGESDQNCGPFQETTAYRCDWVPAGGWQCSGPLPALTPPTPVPVDDGRCYGPVEATAAEAKANFGDSDENCGPFQETTDYRCDWVPEGGWQCSGPAVVVAVVEARCYGPVEATALEAKANFGESDENCGPFMETPEYRCDWVTSGWQCSGPLPDS